jgi:hypothetical protein
MLPAWELQPGANCPRDLVETEEFFPGRIVRVVDAGGLAPDCRGRGWAVARNCLCGGCRWAGAGLPGARLGGGSNRRGLARKMALFSPTSDSRSMSRFSSHRRRLDVLRYGLFVVFAGWATAADASERLLALGVDAGVGAFGADATATFQTGLDVREGNLAFGLYGRVRLLLSGGDAGSVRPRDFDEASDYVHILRYLHYRRRFGTVAFRFGAGEVLGLTLGQGTLLRDYSNVADPDHPQAGALLELDVGPFALRAVLDNLIDPALVAGRLAWRPRALERLAVAASVAVDPRAPNRVLLDSAGQRSIDSAYNLTAQSEVLVLSGIDVSYRFGDIGSAAATPYAAANTSWHGMGFHLGLLGRVALTDSAIDLTAQVEYRGTTGGYAPGYFGPFYDLERYQAGLTFRDPDLAPAAQRTTALANLLEGRHAGHGVLGQIGLEAGEPLQAKLGYSYHPGPQGHRFWLRASTSPIEPLSVGAMIALLGVGAGLQGADGLTILSEARYRFGKHLYALAQLARVWALDAQTRYFAPLHSFNLGLGGTWSD